MNWVKYTILVGDWRLNSTFNENMLMLSVAISLERILLCAAVYKIV